MRKSRLPGGARLPQDLGFAMMELDAMRSGTGGLFLADIVKINDVYTLLIKSCNLPHLDIFLLNGLVMAINHLYRGSMYSQGVQDCEIARAPGF